MLLPFTLSLSGWSVSSKCLFSSSAQCVKQDHQSAVRQPGGFTVSGFRYSEVPEEESLWALWQEKGSIDRQICRDVTQEVTR